MAFFDHEQLITLEEAIKDKLPEVLTLKNRDGTLEQLVADLGLDEVLVDMFSKTARLSTWKEGRILVVGAPQGMLNDLKGVAKSLEIDARRLDFITYDEATNYVFKHLENSPKWCAVLFGASPHSASGKGKDSSILTHLENNRDRFPETKRLWAASRLKVTKTNFRTALIELMEAGIVARDY